MIDLEELARRWFAAWAARDFDALTALYELDAEYIRPDGSEKGVDAIIAYRRQVARAFPDEVANVQAVLVSPDGVTVEWTQSGTFTGPMMTEQLGIVEPTGKAFKDLRVVDIFRFWDGKIVSDHQYYDLLALLRQLGWTTYSPVGRSQSGPPEFT